MSRLSERQAKTIGLTFLLLVCALSAIAIPLANRGILPGSNVRDETLDLAVSELLNGRYPYYVSVSPREPVTPLPGSLLLATPFAWLGTSAYQNFLWLFAFYLALSKYLGDSRLSLALLATIFIGSPVMIHELVSGSDLLANTLWVVLIVIGVANYRSLSTWQRIALAVFSGIAFSSRFNFLAITPLMFVALAQNTGYRQALRYAVIAALVFLVVTVPFYSYDPKGFSPLHVVRFVNRFDALLPHSGVVIPGMSVVLSLSLSLRKMSKSLTIMENCAIVLAAPTFLGIILLTLSSRAFEVGSYSNFGVSFMFFAVIALWQRRAQQTWSGLITH